jgi:hypothetical protein
MMIALFGIMYFLMIRPQMKRAEGAPDLISQAGHGRRGHHQQRHRRPRPRAGRELHHGRDRRRRAVKMQRAAITGGAAQGHVEVGLSRPNT